MDLKTAVVLFLSGLCFLPASFAGKYKVVEKGMTWTEAQSRCRETFTDLASVNSEEDMTELRNVVGSSMFWLGLSLDVHSWSWSLKKDGFYDNEDAEFRNWKQDAPNNDRGQENCVRMNKDGTWEDVPCIHQYTFVCYNDTDNVLPSFIFVNKTLSWMDAQSYCRQHRTDLASARNQSENGHIQRTGNSQLLWIGLYRGPWKWSDGSSTAFMRETTSINETHASSLTSCGVIKNKTLTVSGCKLKLSSVCQIGEIKENKQIIRVQTTVEDSSVNLEDAAETILQKVTKTLEQHGLSREITVAWRKQADGKIFKIKEKRKKKVKMSAKEC